MQPLAQMTPNLLIQGGTLLHPLTGDAHRADARIAMA